MRYAFPPNTIRSCALSPNIAKISISPEEMKEINDSIDKCDLYTQWNEDSVFKATESLPPFLCFTHPCCII